MSSSNNFNYGLVRAFNIHSSSAQSTSPLFTSTPLKHPSVAPRTTSNASNASIITLPTKFSRAHVLPVSPPVPHRRAPRPPVKYVPRNHFRSNHLLSPLHEPGRKGLWTVSEDEHGEREAEMEEAIRKSQCAAFEEALMRWQAENQEEEARPASTADRFVDVDLYDNNAFSCSTSCTSEDVSHCVTPSIEHDDPLEDVFLVSAAASERPGRASTCSFETIARDEDRDLFFVPSSSCRPKPDIDALDLTAHRIRQDTWEYGFALTPRTSSAESPEPPASSEDSFGSRISPSRELFNPSTAFADASRRPPPLDLKNSLAWRVSLEPNFLVLGSPFSPTPASTRSQAQDAPSSLLSPISLDITTPKNAIGFSLTTPPPLSRSSRSSSLSSTGSSTQPITPSPVTGQTCDMLSSTFGNFLISAEEYPRPYISLPQDVASPAMAEGESKDEMRFPLPPFRLSEELPLTPTRPNNRDDTIRAPGAPFRPTHRPVLPPPSSSALQKLMGMRSNTRSRPNDPTHDPARSRISIPKSCGALQMATGLISPAPTTRSNKSSASASSTTSSASASSSTSRRSLPQRKPLPMDWIGYHPKEHRI